jgi:hypothetical protein
MVFCPDAGNHFKWPEITFCFAGVDAPENRVLVPSASTVTGFIGSSPASPALPPCFISLSRSVPLSVSLSGSLPLVCISPSTDLSLSSLISLSRSLCVSAREEERQVEKKKKKEERVKEEKGVSGVFPIEGKV